MAPLTVEIWSDVVCRWCYLGKRRFEKALEGFEHRDEVAVVWRSFELEPGHSFDAHRLIQLAKEHGRQDAMKERLMRAHFMEEADVSDGETLVRLALEVGVDPRGLANGAYADAVRADEELAARIGIQGVPYFVLGRRYSVSGAQPPEQLLQALEKAWADAA